MPYAGNFSAVFSFFGGNVNGDSKLGGNCMWCVATCFWRRNIRQIPFPTVYLVHVPFERLIWRFNDKTRVKNNRESYGYNVSS